MYGNFPPVFAINTELYVYFIMVILRLFPGITSLLNLNTSNEKTCLLYVYFHVCVHILLIMPTPICRWLPPV